MSHLSILAGLFANLLTLAAALYAWWLHRELRANVTGVFAVFMGLICVADLAELIVHYLSANTGLVGARFNMAASITIVVPTLLAALALVRLTERILQKSHPVMPFIITTLASIQLAVLWASDSGFGSSMVVAGVIQLTQALILGVFLWLAANLILEKGRAATFVQRPVAWLGLWVAFRPSFEVPIYAMTSAGWLPYDVAVFSLAFVEGLCALAVLVGARRVATAIIGANSVDMPVQTGLTPRELQVAELVASGLANKEAARELKVSPSTVRDHLSSIYRKTGLRNRVELSMFICIQNCPRICIENCPTLRA